jgi:hypothetical protein
LEAFQLDLAFILLLEPELAKLGKSLEVLEPFPVDLGISKIREVSEPSP